MKNYGFMPYEIPDCLQIGFMVLWETLSTQRDFLAQKTRRQAVFFVLARCKISSMRCGEYRYDSLDALIEQLTGTTPPENTSSTGLQHQHGERWAGWATEIDTRVDIEWIMCKLADKYADSLKHLVALYYLTTQVGKEDAAHIVPSERLALVSQICDPGLKMCSTSSRRCSWNGIATHRRNPSHRLLNARKRGTLPRTKVSYTIAHASCTSCG